MTNNTPDYEDNLYFEEKKMENIDKEPTYYVSLTEYNEVKRMFLKANNEINTLKELLKECELWFTGIVGNMNDKNVGEHNRSLPIGNFEHIFKVFSQKINEVLK